jgi:hypothetical protein
MTTPSPSRLQRVIELACRAPSAHNTQPWQWRIVGDAAIELYADRTRQLSFADPDGRNLMISCGAALHHAVEAARSLGMAPAVELSPVPYDDDLLARVELSPAREPEDATTRLLIMEQRATDRRRFTSWPVPDSRLATLTQAASGWDARAIPITDDATRFRAELVMERAMTLQAADRRYADEQAIWLERGTPGSVPSGIGVQRGTRIMEGSDGLMAICTSYDDHEAWLQAGQTLSALWLHATRVGLSIVPLSHAIEVPETRYALHHDVFGDLAHPQLLLRVGWQEIARTTLPRTPRRPLADVLVRAQVDCHG